MVAKVPQAYPSRELVRLAVTDLQRQYSPLLVVSIPCMLAAGVPTCSSAAQAEDKAIPFGSREEKKWLEDYFHIPGGPRGKPYFMPATREWVQERYADRALQRRRKDFDGIVFYHPDTARWALREGAAAALRDKVLGKQEPIRLAALMAWMWRQHPMKTVQAGLDEFIDELGLDRDQLLGTVYSRELPSEYVDAGLGSEPLTRDAIADLVGASPPPPAGIKVVDLVSRIEQILRERHYDVPEGIVRRIVAGWLVGDIVVLVGPTGSGKTSLARHLGNALGSVIEGGRLSTSFLEIAPDFDHAQFLGYENLSGEFAAGRFAREVLFVGRPSDPRLVILDEWNLAQIDNYFASVLSVIETGDSSRLPGTVNLEEMNQDQRDDLLLAQPEIASGLWSLPTDTFFLATCNSWIDEPESRLPVSGPVRRRCKVIQLPNALAERFDRDGVRGIEHICDMLLAQERLDVDARAQSQDVSVFDTHRERKLGDVSTIAKLDSDARETLTRVVRLLLQDPENRSTFTVGLLRDVLLSCVYADTDAQTLALGEQICDKVILQMHGERAVLERLVEVTTELPNAAEIRRHASLMGAFTDELRLRPLI